MGSLSLPASSSTKKESNIQCLLDSLTPNVRSKSIPKSCIQDFNSKGNTSEKEISTEYFMLKDVWKSFEKWSYYGQGTEVILKNGDKISQYFTPYLSAVQISVNSKFYKVDSVQNGYGNGTTSQSAESKCTELFRSSSNTSGNSKVWDSSSGSPSCSDPERKEVCLFNRHFEFYEDQNPYNRIPLFDKIQLLAQENPGLMTLRSTDLLPSSWIAVAWYPVYNIPVKVQVAKDLSAAFITFHKLTSFHQVPFADTAVDPAHEKSGNEEMKAVVNKKATKKGHQTMPLPTFGLASLHMTGDVWLINGDSDKERYADLYNAACSWIKKRHFYHHDFNFFANNNLCRGKKI